MDADRKRRPRCPHQDMRVGVVAEQHGLEEQHGGRPDRRRTAEPRQHHARKHWPDGEQQGALKLQAQASSATQALWIAVPKNHAVTHATE